MNVSIIFALFAGIVIGMFIFWLLGQKHSKRSVESDKELLLLTERAQNSQSKILALQTDIQAANQRIETLNTELIDSRVLLSAAQERNSLIPGLEEHLGKKEQLLASYVSQMIELRKQLTEAESTRIHEAKSFEGQIKLLTDVKEQLQGVFKTILADALNTNNKSFIDLATAVFQKHQSEAHSDLESKEKAINQLVQPLGESLKEVESKIQELEKTRVGAYELLTGQVDRLIETQNRLQQALRTPAARGRWGEFQLKRIVELAGMVEHCDFDEQKTLEGDNGRLRPDMIVKLTEGRMIVVDSKVPLQAYLDAIESHNDETRRPFLESHARQLKKHIEQLAGKDYVRYVSPSPDFVVMFLPNDAVLAAAYEQDPSIIEYAVSNKVLIATPMTLMALLHTVAYVWRQEAVAENASKVSRLGKTMYDRLRTLSEHFMKLRKSLEKSVEAYNDITSCMESRVLVQARKFRELGAADGAEIEVLDLSDADLKLALPSSLVAVQIAEAIDVTDAPTKELTVTSLDAQCANRADN